MPWKDTAAVFLLIHPLVHPENDLFVPLITLFCGSKCTKSIYCNFEHKNTVQLSIIVQQGSFTRSYSILIWKHNYCTWGGGSFSGNEVGGIICRDGIGRRIGHGFQVNYTHFLRLSDTVRTRDSLHNTSPFLYCFTKTLEKYGFLRRYVSISLIFTSSISCGL